MSGDPAVIIVAVIGTGVALGLLIVPGQREIRRGGVKLYHGLGGSLSP